MELLILGGTFDPPHLGHLHLADMASKHFGGLPVLFIPAHSPAHKSGQDVSPAPVRLAMLEAALAGTEWRPETLELERGGTSYTVETVRELKERYNLKEPPGLIMGDDLAEGFSRWRNPEEILQETQIVLAVRQGGVPFPYPHVGLDNAILPISSSDIRERIRDGRAFRFLLPSGVYDYIVKQGMYGYRR
jgi:nicotinate-nucleotide adenylyltransferase